MEQVISDLATTRPETLLGDTAVAVNPNDDRYKDYGRKDCLHFLLVTQRDSYYCR